MNCLFKKYVLSYSLVVSFFQLSAQEPAFEWVRQFSGNAYKFAFGAVSDKSGAVYSVGYFDETVDFDSGNGQSSLQSTGESDVFISKLDGDGNFIWAKQIGGPSTDIARDIAIDYNLDLYITGYFSGTADFDPSPAVFNLTSAGASDAFVCKLDSAGNFIWAKRFGGVDGDQTRAIAVDNTGNSYTVGSFFAECDFSPGIGTNSLTSVNYSQDAFICKLNKDGDFQWVAQIGGDNVEAIMDVNADNPESVFATGLLFGTTDFDPGPAQYTLSSVDDSEDSFVLRLNSQGNFVWAKLISGPNREEPRGIAVDASGVYTTGLFEGTIDADPGTNTLSFTADSSYNTYLSKLDLSGNMLWSKHYKSASNIIGSALAVDEEMNLYATGSFRGNAVLDPTGENKTITTEATNAGASYITKLDSDGNFIWAVQLAGASELDLISAWAIFIDPNNSIYTTGKLTGTGDFDPDSPVYNVSCSSSSSDIFINKLKQERQTGIPFTKTPEPLSLFPNPADESILLNFIAEYSENITLIITDFAGRLIETNRKLYCKTGINSIQINTKQLANGIYHLSLHANQTSITKPLIVNHNQ